MKFAQYGNKIMKREYCKKCQGMALVIDNILQCCDTKIINKPKGITHMCDAVNRKRQPSVSDREQILKLQNNKCLYCNRPFGVLYIRDGKVKQTRLNWDHLIPFVYSQNNKHNFVAACNICNSIKSSLMFDTVEEAFYYINHTRNKKGIKFIDDIPNPEGDIND